MNKTIKPSEPREHSKGLICRTCGYRHFRVLYTRRASGDRLLRRRMCRHCGRRMPT